MLKNKKHKLFKTLDLTVKSAIIISAFLFIYKEIFVKNDFAAISKSLQEISITKGYSNIIFVFALMFLNWLIEAIKWKYLIRKIEDISWFKSVKAIMSGVTFSIFTPNRIGEFGGKIFYVERENRVKAFLVSIIGSISQLLVTIIIGIVSLVFFLSNFSGFKNTINSYLFYSLIIFLIFSVFILLILFLNSHYLKTILGKISFFHRFKKYYKVFSLYKSSELLNLLLLSVFRYFVFTIQFYIVLKFLNVEISFFSGVMMIALIYFSIAAIPTMALTEIGVRGSVSLYFLGMLSGNSVGIVSASLLIWIINLAIPALIGSVFIYGLRFLKKN